MTPEFTPPTTYASSIEYAGRNIRRAIGAHGSLEQLAYTFEQRYTEGDDASHKAELMRLRRFALTATEATPGITEKDTYNFYRGELLGLYNLSRIVDSDPSPSANIQHVISMLSKEATDPLAEVGNTVIGSADPVPMPKNAAFLHEQRLRSIGGEFFAHAVESVDFLGAEYDTLKRTMLELTQHMPADEAMMLLSGHWLVVREGLQPSAYAKQTREALESPLLSNVPQRINQSTPSVAPLDSFMPFMPEYDDNEAPEFYFASIDALRDSLIARTSAARQDFGYTKSLEVIKIFQKDLETILNDYLDTHGSLAPDTIITANGNLFYYTDIEDTRMNLQFGALQAGSELRGKFEGIVVHKAPTQKALKQYRPSDPSTNPNVYDSLTPHFRLSDVTAFNKDTEVIEAYFPGYVDIPLTYEGTHFEASFEASE
jgi:hypothetical protein